MATAGPNAGAPPFAGGFSITLRVDAPETAAKTGGMLGPDSVALRNRIYAELKLKQFSAAWITIVPGAAKGDAALARLITEREAGHLVVGSATLTENINWSAAGTAEWFLLNTKQVDDFNLWDAYPGCKAGTLPPVHALNHTFVSSAFVNACTMARLRGISFLQCEHRGRKPGPPWFAALPEHSMGRGLDHPWFDRRGWSRDVGGRPNSRTSAVNIGQSAFHQCWLRDDASHPVLTALLRLCPMPERFTSGLDGFKVAGIPRYWSGAIPDADFAYIPWGEDGANREGKMMRFRQLMVHARARQALLAAGLFQEKAFLPVAVRDAAAPGQLLLDQPAKPIPPMYSAAELAALRAREQQLKAANA